MGEKKGLFTIWLTAIAIVILAGLYTAFRLFTEGHVLFNSNDVIIWSLPLGVYIFLTLTSSGLTLMSAIPLVFGYKQFEPFAKRLVFLAIATLCGAFVAIGLELGMPWHIYYILISPNLSTPIWWMGAIYSVELVLLALKFWKMQSGDWHSQFSKALGVAAFLGAVIAPLMIGSVFGITESRVTYFGPIMSIYCLVIALLSGFALFILYSMVLSWITNVSLTNKHSAIYDDVMVVFTYVAGIVVMITLLKVAIESTTVIPDFLMIRKFQGPLGKFLSIPIEIILGVFVPFILLMIPNVRKNFYGKVISSGLIWVGCLGIHMQSLISGQSHPIGPKAEQYPDLLLPYFPSVWEWLVFLFAMAVICLLNTLGERYLNLEAAPE